MAFNNFILATEEPQLVKILRSIVIDPLETRNPHEVMNDMLVGRTPNKKCNRGKGGYENTELIFILHIYHPKQKTMQNDSSWYGYIGVKMTYGEIMSICDYQKSKDNRLNQWKFPLDTLLSLTNADIQTPTRNLILNSQNQATNLRGYSFLSNQFQLHRILSFDALQSLIKFGVKRERRKRKTKIYKRKRTIKNRKSSYPIVYTVIQSEQDIKTISLDDRNALINLPNHSIFYLNVPKIKKDTPYIITK